MHPRKYIKRLESDCILVGKNRNTKVFDVRSYNSYTTTSDPKPGLCNIKTSWSCSRILKVKKKLLNMGNLRKNTIVWPFATEASTLL